MALFVLAAGMIALGIGALIVTVPIAIVVHLVRSGRRGAVRVTSDVEERTFEDLITREWPRDLD